MDRLDATELQQARSEIEQLRSELELERMRAAACMTASVGNLPESVAQRIDRDHPYWSQAYEDVCAAVDREMALRQRLEALEVPPIVLKPFDRDRHQVIWKPTRPELSICILGGTSVNCLHETDYEVVSRWPLNREQFKMLDAMGLLGMGQDYRVLTTETLKDTVPPVVEDRFTGRVVPDVAPINVCTLEPFTRTNDYEYRRYVVRRTCDSGD